MVRGRLRRDADPDLAEAERERRVADLLRVRSVVRIARRNSDDAAKIGLGERGPVWWTDGAPDQNRHMARTTVYADGFAGLEQAP